MTAAGRGEKGEQRRGKERRERGDARRRESGNAGPRTMICPVCITATLQIAKLLDPPPAGSTDVYTNLTRGGSSIGRLTSASTCGSGKARVVVSALMAHAHTESK